MDCLLLTDDLIFNQQVANGLGPNWSVKSATQLTDSDWAGVVVDLNLGGLDCAAIVQFCQEKKIPLCGIASHVHVAKIEAAKQAGIATVLTRGQVSSHLASAMQPIA